MNPAAWHRGLVLAPFCYLSWNMWWLFWPDLTLAIIAYGWGCAAVVAALVRFDFGPARVAWWAVGVAVVVTVLAAFGEHNLARAGSGAVVLLAFFLAYRGINRDYDVALTIGIAAEFVAWLIGNLGRGNFSPPEAISALAQTIGPYAPVAIILVVLTAYGSSWNRYRHDRA